MDKIINEHRPVSPYSSLMRKALQKNRNILYEFHRDLSSNKLCRDVIAIYSKMEQFWSNQCVGDKGLPSKEEL